MTGTMKTAPTPTGHLAPRSMVRHALEDLRGYLSPATEARSLPPVLYVADEVFAREEEEIFARDWFCVARSSELAEVGRYLCFTIGSEPVVVIRALDGLHAMSPICRHRGMPVVEPGTGTAERFTCRYHLWKYDQDGRLLGAPYMADSPGFDPDQTALPKLSVSEWLGFVFVSLDPDAESLHELLEPLTADLGPHQLESAVVVARYDSVWECNWKIAVENASESYHHMGLHAETVNPFLPSRGTYVCDGSDWWAHHRTPLAARAETTLDTLSEDDLTEAKVYTIFPSTVIVTSGELCNWQSWIPLSANQTRVIATFLLPKNSLPQQSGNDPVLQASLDLFNAEDLVANAGIQRVAASRFAAPGHLSPKEGGLVDFYRYLARRLGGSGDLVGG